MLRIGRIQPTLGSDLTTTNASGSTMTGGASAARTAVGEAMAARRSRPPLAVPLSATWTRPLDKKTTSGITVAFLDGRLGGRVFQHLGSAGVGARGVGAVVTFVGISGDILSFLHQVRAARRKSRLTRILKQFTKACEGFAGRRSRRPRTSTFRFTIVNGPIFNAALAVCML